MRRLLPLRKTQSAIVDALREQGHQSGMPKRKEPQLPKDCLTPEQGARLQQLYQQRDEAHARAQAAIAEKGMSSREFLEADADGGRINREIKELHGSVGKHWMAS